MNIPTNLEVDNIDWQNKGLMGKEQTHNTNSILIQQTNTSEASQSSIQLNLTIILIANNIIHLKVKQPVYHSSLEVIHFNPP